MLFRFLEKVFVWRSAVLLLSLNFFLVFLAAFISVNNNEIKLIAHTGDIKSKKLIRNSDSDGNESWELILGLTDDTTKYKISANAHWIDKCVAEGDTVQLFTLGNFSQMGEAVMSDNGFKLSFNQFEVFQMISKKDSTLLLNFKANRKNLQKNVWWMLVVSLLLFAWYYYLGYKNKVSVTEHDDGYTN